MEMNEKTKPPGTAPGMKLNARPAGYQLSRLDRTRGRRLECTEYPLTEERSKKDCLLLLKHVYWKMTGPGTSRCLRIGP